MKNMDEKDVQKEHLNEQKEENVTAENKAEELAPEETPASKEPAPKETAVPEEQPIEDKKETSVEDSTPVKKETAVPEEQLTEDKKEKSVEDSTPVKKETPEKPSGGPVVLIDDSEEEKINNAYDDDVDYEDTSQEKVSPEPPAETASQSEVIDEAEVKAEDEAEVKVEAKAEDEAEAKAEGEAPEPEPEPEPPEPKVDFSLLSKEDLVKLLKEKLDHPGRGNVKELYEEIKGAFDHKITNETEAKKQKFLEEGGVEEDFKPAEEPVEREMKELLHKYRGLKAELTRQLEKSKQENLLKKQHILEEFRRLMEGQDCFETTFRRFKELQKEWFAAGVVPHQNLKDLWDSYNYFVEKFNDYVRINRDLRALDLKKNLELKEQLCLRTEELDKEENVIQAFKVLQKNHSRWREIGPVPRESRDEIWERFKAATSVINRKHQEHHSRMKESLHENLEKKKSLCEQVETIAAVNNASHSSWAEETKKVLEIQKTWKTIGYAPKKENNNIYARFRTACDVFFGNKAKFYSAAFDEQKENLKLKLAIVEKAEELSGNESWKETSTELIRLQKEWKEIGPVPRRDSDRLWKRFRSACDAFFNKKSAYYKDADSNFEENMKAKLELLSEMEDYKAGDDYKQVLSDLKSFHARYNEIGFVPASKKDEIRDKFRKAQDLLLEKTDMNESQVSLYKFKYRIESILQAPRAEIKLNFERDKLVNRLQQLRSEIGVWENNIGFFKQSDSSEETIQNFQEKIDAAHERIHVLEEKIRIIDDMENDN